MHEGLWQKLVLLDPHQTARKAHCEYLGDSTGYAVTLLGQGYVVDTNESRIFHENSQGQISNATFTQQLCILACLINASDVPLAGKLVTSDKLEGGQFFFRGPHALPTQKLQNTFGKNPKLLHKAAEQFSAVQCEFGDASVELLVLPKVPLTFIIWAEDDEFDARASILFDQTASVQLPLDALLAAVNLTVDSLINTAADA